MKVINVKLTNIQLDIATEGVLYVLPEVANRIELCQLTIRSYITDNVLYNYRIGFTDEKAKTYDQPYDIDHVAYMFPTTNIQTVPVKYKLHHPQEFTIDMIVPFDFESESDEYKREYVYGEATALLDQYLPIHVEIIL